MSKLSFLHKLNYNFFFKFSNKKKLYSIIFFQAFHYTGCFGKLKNFLIFQKFKNNFLKIKNIYTRIFFSFKFSIKILFEKHQGWEKKISFSFLSTTHQIQWAVEIG